MSKTITTLEKSRRFYDNKIAPMIRERFPEYEKRIAVGVAGEGSDCFGYDDFVSRDHDFGTGVCLWLTNEDHEKIGNLLSIAYNEFVDANPGGRALTARLRERRGVMTTKMFYSNLLDIECDTENCRLTEEEWLRLDHICLATATNGEVFRDDLGEFTRFRELLLSYYPDRVWIIRLINELHLFASSVQINYARCMTRGDVVAAEMCRMRGVDSAMNLYFLLNRKYPPYYKWTFRALTELDNSEDFAEMVKAMSTARLDTSVWEGRPYDADRMNMNDMVVANAEQIAAMIVRGLQSYGLTEKNAPYLELYCDELKALLKTGTRSLSIKI